MPRALGMVLNAICKENLISENNIVVSVLISAQVSHIFGIFGKCFRKCISTAERWKGLIHHMHSWCRTFFFVAFITVNEFELECDNTTHNCNIWNNLLSSLCLSSSWKCDKTGVQCSAFINLIAFKNTFLAFQFMEIDSTMYTFWMLNAGYWMPEYVLYAIKMNIRRAEFS